MSNALRNRRNELLEEELQEEVELREKNKQEEIQNEKDKTPVPDNPEEETFRKRYGDLRRHAAKVEKELKDKISSLETAIEEKNISYPKTEEEVTNWAKNYPDLYKIIETMIMKREKGATEKVSERLKRVDELERELDREKAMKQLLEAHPDFPKIRDSQEFHDWLATKSKAIQNIMYEDGADVMDAIEVVSLYKELILNKKEKKESPKKADAARPTPSGPRSAPSFEGEHFFKESEVQRMNEREYLKYEAEIEKQIAAGKFVYDISGAAR